MSVQEIPAVSPAEISTTVFPREDPRPRDPRREKSVGRSPRHFDGAKLASAADFPDPAAQTSASSPLQRSARWK
jgi:hypothetical protein